uniref:Glycosyltransferase n=1 Tax=Araucaria cunninghamii TaxID=56994 RepID=A0A0D6QXA9_ARACU
MECVLQMKKSVKPHFVVVPFPSQGHINPLMEFGKRLASKNLLVTIVITEISKKRMAEAQDAVRTSTPLGIRFETIPVGNLDTDDMLDQLRKVGGPSFEQLIQRLNDEGKPVSCIVLDSYGLEWVVDIAKKFSIPSAIFWSQSCAVYSIYYHYVKGLIKVEAGREAIEISGLPQLRIEEVPSFLHPSDSYAAVLRNVLRQLNIMSQTTWVLGNSFCQLEGREIKSIESVIPIRTVGPLVPSGFLEGKTPGEVEMIPHMWKAANCVEWLNTKGPSTVVYVSFGSVAVVSKEQIEEIAIGLKACGHPFLWVIRPVSNKGNNNDIPDGFVEETSDKGLVVPWSPQMQVLSHPAVGVFLTHCGWNSTLEGMSSGVPMLAAPQWTDQTTNAKYVEEEWKTGIRLKKREDGLIGREEVENSIRIVMESEVGLQLRNNALRWKTLAREAMAKGGSSDKNIDYFIEDVIGRASSMPHAVAD